MSKRVICEVCQTEYNADLDACPVCDTLRPEEMEMPDTPSTSAAWKKAAVAALSILLVLFTAFIAYEFLFGQSKSTEQVSCTGLYLTEPAVELTEPAQVMFLNVHATPSDTTDEISYQSADSTIATVNADGRIEAVSEGQTQIIVTCGNYTAQCDVICDFSPDDTE